MEDPAQADVPTAVEGPALASDSNNDVDHDAAPADLLKKEQVPQVHLRGKADVPTAVDDPAQRELET